MKQLLTAVLATATLVLSSCHPQAHVENIDVGYAEMNVQGGYRDTAVAAIIAPYKTKLDKEMNEVLGVSDQAMPKEREPLETLLGDFIADLTLKSANQLLAKNGTLKADIVLLNNGGMRTSLPKGEITKGKIFEIMPFDNEIVLVTISGSQMKALLNFAAQSTGLPVAGMKMGIKDGKPGTVLINGQAFDENKNYVVVTSDYLANGGDNMKFFSAPVQFQSTGVLMRNAMIDYVQNETKAGRTINVKLDGRIYHE